MSTRPTLSALLLVVGLTGCADAGVHRGGDDELAVAGSCAGACGDRSAGGCYCDADCVANGDCCVDASEVCNLEHACGDEGGGGGQAGDGACFLGEDRSGATCFPLVSGDFYDYPSPLNANYREPIAYLDVQSIDLSTKIAPNFRLSEISVPHKGQWQVVQPHAIEKLQAVRDEAGGLSVKSGFRSPEYNAQQPGAATRSRHMYGDAFDLLPSAVSQQKLYEICNSHGAGYTAKYTSGHVHCDWRNISVDPLFYGALATDPDAPRDFTIADLVASIEEDDGTFRVEADGYDTTEGELTREWFAVAADGTVLAQEEAPTFVPPAGTSSLRVDVGGLIELEHDL